jgi:hypothetical protein
VHSVGCLCQVQQCTVRTLNSIFIRKKSTLAVFSSAVTIYSMYLPYILAERYKHFEGSSYQPFYPTTNMEEVGFFETLVPVYQSNSDISQLSVVYGTMCVSIYTQSN